MAVVLVVPAAMDFGAGMIPADAPSEHDPPIEYLDLRGENSRLWTLVGLRRVLYRHHPKLIVLDNDPASVMAVQIGFWSRLGRTGSKLLCISCENLPLGVVASLKRRGMAVLPATLFKRSLLAIARNVVDGVFTINHEGTEIFKRERFRNVMRIPLGFEPKYFRIDSGARAARRATLRLDGFVIGCFGRITFEKGVHILVSALEQLTDCQWTLVIDEFDKYKTAYGVEIQRRLSGPTLKHRVVCVDPAYAEMGEYINAVDVVVMPSVSTPVWKEQYGRVSAEAMACGKVVVASESGALPMLLNGHGVLFQEGDVEALVTILRTIITAPSGAHPSRAEQISGYAHAMLSTKRQMEQMSILFEDVRPGFGQVA